MTSTNKRLCHPCREKGMKQIGGFVSEDRYNKLKIYCKKNKVSITDLINSAFAKILQDA